MPNSGRLTRLLILPHFPLSNYGLNVSKVFMHASNKSTKEKIEAALDGTTVHQRQSDLSLGKWDFVVFGPILGEKSAVIRIGVAEQAMIQQAPLYVASLGDPRVIGHAGIMSLNSLTNGDILDEFKDLEVFHVSPLRPMTITDKRNVENTNRMRDNIFTEFGNTNIAIIETPDQSIWIVSVLKYLHECDEVFPDLFMSFIRQETNNRFKENDSESEQTH